MGKIKRLRDITQDELIIGEFKSLPNPDEPLFIFLPRGWLLSRVVKHWIAFFVLIIMSTGFFMFFAISVPLLGVVAHRYYILSTHWKRYNCSAGLLHTSTILIWIIAIIAALPIKESVMDFLRLIRYN